MTHASSAKSKVDVLKIDHSHSVVSAAVGSCIAVASTGATYSQYLLKVVGGGVRRQSSSLDGIAKQRCWYNHVVHGVKVLLCIIVLLENDS